MATATQDWIGLTLCDRYTVQRKLGEGGMGAVLLAHDRRLGADVVIKVPRRELLSSPEFVERFREEIRALVKLTHPHVVKVTDADVHDGVPFAVLQFLAGGSLESQRQSKAGGGFEPVAPKSLDSWLPQVAAALDFLHKQNYVHRDVKPANILFDEHGNAYLGDFGVVKALAAHEEGRRGQTLTGTGLVLGTPQYMSPELIMGQPFDGRSDQYALAVVVYEMLCGRRPFEADAPSAVLVLHTTKAPVPPSSLASGVSAAVSQAVLRGLAKRPSQRYASCEEFTQAVLAAVAGQAPAADLSATSPHMSQGKPGQVPCPRCQKVLPLKPKYAGRVIACPHCQTALRVAESLDQLTIDAAATAKLALKRPAASADTDGFSADLTPSHTSLPARGVGSASITLTRKTAAAAPSSGISPLVWAVVGAAAGVLFLAGVLLVLMPRGAQNANVIATPPQPSAQASPVAPPEGAGATVTPPASIPPPASTTEESALPPPQASKPSPPSSGASPEAPNTVQQQAAMEPSKPDAANPATKLGQPAFDLTGRWISVAHTSDGEIIESELDLTQTGGEIRGRAIWTHVETPSMVSGTIVGDEVTLVATIDRPSNKALTTVRSTGKVVDSDRITGSSEYETGGSRGTAVFETKRKTSAEQPMPASSLPTIPSPDASAEGDPSGQPAAVGHRSSAASPRDAFESPRELILATGRVKLPDGEELIVFPRQLPDSASQLASNLSVLRNASVDQIPREEGAFGILALDGSGFAGFRGIKRDLRAIYQDRSGSAAIQLEYKEDKRHGPLVQFDPEGRRELAGEYREGRRSGAWCYFQDGQPCLVQVYRARDRETHLILADRVVQDIDLNSSRVGAVNRQDWDKVVSTRDRADRRQEEIIAAADASFEKEAKAWLADWKKHKESERKKRREDIQRQGQERGAPIQKRIQDFRNGR